MFPCRDRFEIDSEVTMQVRKRLFCAAIYTKNASFYQDRLGTNIGKVEKKSGVFPYDVGPFGLLNASLSVMC